VQWWNEAFPEGAAPDDLGKAISFERAREIAAALAKLRSRSAVVGLGRGLPSVRLRRYIADALGAIGEPAARPELAKALASERYQDARVALARALAALDGTVELREPLVRFLGVPDPMPKGLELAEQAGILEFVGGPRKRVLGRLRRFVNSGVSVGLIVPKGGNGTGLRALVRARSKDGAPGEVRFGLPEVGPHLSRDTKGDVPTDAPPLDPRLTVALKVAPLAEFLEIYDTLPPPVAQAVKPGDYAEFVLYATQNIEVASCAVVPLADEIPPPKPRPWRDESLPAADAGAAPGPAGAD